MGLIVSDLFALLFHYLCDDGSHTDRLTETNLHWCAEVIVLSFHVTFLLFDNSIRQTLRPKSCFNLIHLSDSINTFLIQINLGSLILYIMSTVTEAALENIYSHSLNGKNIIIFVLTLQE